MNIKRMVLGTLAGLALLVTTSANAGGYNHNNWSLGISWHNGTPNYQLSFTPVHYAPHHYAPPRRSHRAHHGHWRKQAKRHHRARHYHQKRYNRHHNKRHYRHHNRQRHHNYNRWHH